MRSWAGTQSSIYLSICLSTYLSIYLSIYLSAFWFQRVPHAPGSCSMEFDTQLLARSWESGLRACCRRKLLWILALGWLSLGTWTLSKPMVHLEPPGPNSGPTFESPASDWQFLLEGREGKGRQPAQGLPERETHSLKMGRAVPG